MAALRALPRGLVRAVQLCVAVGLLAWLWQAADGAEAARHLARAEPVWLVAALVALTVQTVLSALRWRVTAAQMGIAIDGATAVREYYLSQIVNQALPGGVLGDAGRALRARAQAGLLASGQAVVFERLAGQVAIFLLMVLAFLVTLAVPGGLDWPRWAIWPVATLVGLGVAVPVAMWLVARVAPGPARGALMRLGHDLRRCLFAPEVRWRQLGLSLGTALANVAGFMCCAAAIGAPIPLGAALALVPLILFTMLVPITISGWGLREGAAATLLPLAGVTSAEAMAASVAFGLVFLASSLPGVAVVFIGQTRSAT